MTPDADRERLIADVFVCFADIWGAAWKQRTAEAADAVRLVTLWTVALEGLSDARIRAGMVNLIRSGLEFPPVPGKFRELCAIDPVELGLPSADEAYYQATGPIEHRAWVVRCALATLAGEGIDAHWLRTHFDPGTRRKFAAAYADTVELAAAGELPPKPAEDWAMIGRHVPDGPRVRRAQMANASEYLRKWREKLDPEGERA